ncbi:transglycosylase domain-containing protein [Aliiroseovarius sp. KMU-50]|uniref:peptidoglycan glycosyltransferase n=1 Tax=Aliiroseovarius salicola TaxID=3009082 RepID=A0ABT4VWI4_9RHOB|nr:transglycosylase domain-containing protein [Aliiroseovarius sp. KMU-50]MDA5092621.1 transglycosylase domain-containing protein [Aliiroseovarius sp. KMU-50]
MSPSGRNRPVLVADKRYSSSKAAAKKPAAKKAAPKRKSPAPKRGGGGKKGGGGILMWPVHLVMWVLRLIWRLMWKGAVVVALIIGLAVFYFASTMPELNTMLDGRAKGSVTVLDRYGDVYAWRGDQRGGTVTTETVSPFLRDAVVASEDKRFYRHLGLSPRGIASAIRINMREGRGPLSGHGGSTLTQQVAKLLCLGVPYDADKWDSEAAYEADCRKGSLWRKMKEAVYAMALEAKFSKAEILTIYLNRAYLGAGSHGFDAAARRYFAIPAAKLNPAQAAMLAGMLPKPSVYAPTNNLKRSQDRAATVLRMMREQGYISPKQEKKFQNNPAVLSRAAKAQAGGYFADWIMRDMPAFLTRKTTEDVVIKSTLDPAIQTAAEDAIDWVFENKVREGSKAQAAIVVMSADGAVRAMVGGREKRVVGAFNRATQAKRQTGSSFKPFVYAAALDLGYKWNDFVLDEPYCLNIPGSGEWCPKNYTRKHYGNVSLTEALAKSLNVPAVKVSEAVGREAVKTVASTFGIESDLAAGPALALGASESTLLETTGAYAGILNGGSSVTPYGLTELTLVGDKSPLMTQTGGMGERVISKSAAKQLVYMMSQVVEKGSGHRARLKGREVAGKTGTTQGAKDAWFIGFTADYVAGIWMGYDDNTPLKGVTGGGLPAEIWKVAMKKIHADIPARPLPMIRPGQTPRFEGEVFSSESDTFGRPPSQQGGNLGDVVEDVLINVIRGIFGQGN